MVIAPDGSIVTAVFSRIVWNDDYVSLDHVEIYTLRTWNPSTGECWRSLLDGQDCECNIIIVPDGCIVSGSKDNTLRKWNLATGACERVLEGHTARVTCVAITPDKRIISSSKDSTLRIWDPSSGVCERVLVGHLGGTDHMCITANGHIVTDEGIWNFAAGDCGRELKKDANEATAMMGMYSKKFLSSTFTAVAAGRPLPYINHSGNIRYCCLAGGHLHIVEANECFHFFKSEP